MTRSAHHKEDATQEAEVGRPDWMAEGACLGHHPDLWFSDLGNAAKRAKEICADCPALTLCLQWAIETCQPFGIWGGRTVKERANLRQVAQYNAKKASAA